MGASLAALGFIVVAVDGRGTPYRDKAFQNHNYGDVASTSDFNDRIASIKQLAERYPYMDISRVGITGADGLANSIYGLLDHPDFYKVGVLQCFHDPRFAHAALGEMYDGVLSDGKIATDSKSAEDRVESLQAKLLLIQGMLDFSTPSSTFRLVHALQKANKNFDMLCLPNEAQDVPTYALRRNWDYLVENLKGITSPHEFDLKTGFDLIIDSALEQQSYFSQ